MVLFNQSKKKKNEKQNKKKQKKKKHDFWINLNRLKISIPLVDPFYFYFNVLGFWFNLFYSIIDIH